MLKALTYSSSTNTTNSVERSNAMMHSNYLRSMDFVTQERKRTAQPCSYDESLLIEPLYTCTPILAKAFVSPLKKNSTPRLVRVYKTDRVVMVKKPAKVESSHWSQFEYQKLRND
mgnify:CR=1 FL=1